MQPDIRIETPQILLRVSERRQYGVKIQKMKNGGTKQVPMTRKEVEYALADFSDGLIERRFAESDAVVVSKVYYNTATRTQEACIGGQFSPVRNWIK